MYYKLGINPSSRKWSTYENLSSSLWIDGIEMSSTRLFNYPDLLKGGKHIECLALREGQKAPINSIGADFILFDHSIIDIMSLNVDNNMIAVESKNSDSKYLLLNNFRSIDCVDWDLSEIDPWPKNIDPAKWKNKRARFFIKPVLKKDHIPPHTKIFRLQEWDGAFNIVISDDYKDQIMRLNFDHTFLTFEALTVI